MDVSELLAFTVKNSASDLHLASGEPPMIRINGDMTRIKMPALEERIVQAMIYDIMNDGQRKMFEEHLELDFSFALGDIARFRVNIFKQNRGMSAVFRVIPTEVFTLEQLKCPDIFKKIAMMPRGICLVTGPTGSGKSTTLAAMMDYRNENEKGHILTIEDPIEFVHQSKNSLISQREKGPHTHSFANALKSALREDPDVILVGEMRDLETIHLALTAAEMGILVMATLHTSSAASSIERIINAFPPGEEPYVRTMLSTSLCGVISQQLVRTADNRNRIAAIEIMINNAAVSNIIREGKTEQLDNVIQGGAMQGMQLMDTALKRLVEAKKITGEQAFLAARNKDDFILLRDEIEVEQEEQSITPTDSIN